MPVIQTLTAKEFLTVRFSTRTQISCISQFRPSFIGSFDHVTFCCTILLYIQSFSRLCYLADLSKTCDLIHVL